MKKTGYTKEPIAFVLKQAETGPLVGEVCRRSSIICAGISVPEATAMISPAQKGAFTR
ncbi:transposase [Salmonella enterica subsp. arizonae]|uniref:Transposase n=1 Tax=Salmonella enterica subsp. arizonae TaxID=59203 RepID=A0A2X4T3S6_SALER|nr:transposase [Salmonella enterica subsp. arizonae]SUG18491.1 transposase [Salmonella enterica subsp. arizonae]SUG41217.1 transposase [Salmonella enterica subsp. arizonae]SUG50958.1 transposase [Salmonella enterica subsp. arizonae]